MAQLLTIIWNPSDPRFQRALAPSLCLSDATGENQTLNVERNYCHSERQVKREVKQIIKKNQMLGSG